MSEIDTNDIKKEMDNKNYRDPTDNKELLKWTKKKRKRSNDSMHINNFYRYNPPNFKLLANWKDSNATKELTRVLLDHDFGLRIELPDNYLCPTLTLRINYLYWISDQLKNLKIILNHNDNDNDNDNKIIKGIDIGTGTSCIFPLLGVKLFNNWSFIGIDIDDKVLEYAQNNININSLNSKITLFKNEKNSDILLKLLNYKEGSDTFNSSNDDHQDNDGDDDDEYFADFCLCNPPFFKDLNENNCNNNNNPKSNCTGSVNEMVTDGGEFEFVKRIIKESFQLKCKIRFYTTMIGRKVNLNPLINILIKQYYLPKNQIQTTELVQGNTSRWVLSWYFLNNSTNLESKQNNTINNNININNNNNNNNQFLTRMERRKLYREGITLNLDSDDDDNNNNNNNNNNIVEIIKLILDNNDIIYKTDENNIKYECKYLLNNVIVGSSIKLDRDIEFLFTIFIDLTTRLILFKPIDPKINNNNNNKNNNSCDGEIINSNLFFILKFLENIKNEIKLK
ncbi:hypothetical protein ACTFIR_006980 [Dictyostelium discoideum]